MRLTCENCGAPIPARDINVQTMTAVCESCDAVFQFDPGALKKAKRQKNQKPSHFEVADDDETLVIDYVWRGNMGSLEWGMTLLFTIGALFFTPVAFNILSEASDTAAFVGAGIMGLIALGCIYMVAAILLNRTHMRLDDEWFTTRHGPLYWTGLTLPTESIDRFALKPVENIDNYMSLIAHTEDGRAHTVDVMQKAHAEYTRRRLQHALMATTAEDTPRVDHLADAIDEVRISDEGELLLPGDADTASRA